MVGAGVGVGLGVEVGVWVGFGVGVLVGVVVGVAVGLFWLFCVWLKYDILKAPKANTKTSITAIITNKNFLLIVPELLIEYVRA
jgi:hypothetical protein